MSPTRIILLISILLGLLAAALIKSPSLALSWREAQNRLANNRLVRNYYEAPAHGCEWPDVVRGSYFVFLHHGSSLEDHLQLIEQRLLQNVYDPKKELKLRITHQFPETSHHGLYYCAYDVDIWTLRAIRSDVAVDMIECNRSPEVDIGPPIELIT